MTQKPLLLLAAGGTGGHMFPAQALCEKMQEQGWRVHLSTDVRGARYADGFGPDVPVHVIASATFAHHGIVTKLLVPFRLLHGVWQSWRLIQQQRPAIVVGFGGYPAIPALTAALIRKIPRIIHEQNGVLGRVNQLFAKYVHHVACGTWPTKLPSGVKSQFVGNPLRANVYKRAKAPYIAPSPSAMTLLVMGGSQGAKILSDIVPASIGALPVALRENLQVTHQARPEDVARVRAQYAAQGIRADVQPFFADIARHLVDAQLVISRAGAASVADIAAIGRPAIFVPLAAAIRDEQTANAQALVQAGGAQIIKEPALSISHLAQTIEAILSTPAKAEQMAFAAASCGRVDATQKLAELVQSTARDR